MPVHLRLNDKDTSRNPYINFVTALPGSRHDEALRRLQQLAAMAKPLMSDQAFHINSLEEYEWNKEFAGRCWNNGEVIELVLTRANGDWIPLQYVLYVFCHELAHIKHMNHIPHLHGALTRHLKELALRKQREGYFGDGLWSAGRTVGQGAFVGGLGMHQAQEELPEHVCGGAVSRTRAGRQRAGRRRRNAAAGRVGGRKFKGPSLHTGAQTAANTRGGNRRVKIEAAASGSAGSRVDGRNDLPLASAKSAAYKLDANSTFRKRTQTVDARELRANAALARLAGQSLGIKGEEVDSKAGIVKQENTLQGAFARQASQLPSAGPSRSVVKAEQQDGSETESDGSSHDTEDDEDYPSGDDLVGDDLGEGNELDNFTQGHGETAEDRRRRMSRYGGNENGKNGDVGTNEWTTLFGDESPEAEPSRPEQISTDQPSKRRRVDAEDNKIDDDDDDDIVFVREQSNVPTKKRTTPPASVPPASKSSAATKKDDSPIQWSCQVCTLENDAARHRCEACDTARGQSTLGA